MKLLHTTQRRLARQLKQFNLALMTALAAMALTACGGAAEPVHAASSLSKGVQQILQPSNGGVASSRPSSPTHQGT